MMFRTVTDESEIPGSRCLRCGSSLTYRVFSDSTEETVCSEDRNHDGEICRRLGHPEGWASTERCDLCLAPVQWVRAEVREGRAYTYMAFEDPPLEPDEWVVLPGNSVKGGSFEGRIVRIVDPEKIQQDAYPGPYKAILRRVTPVLFDEQIDNECTCAGSEKDDFCPHHGLL